MQINENEKLEFTTLMLVEGFESYETNFFDSTSYKNLREYMLEYLPYGNMDRFHFDYVPKSEVISAGKFVIDKHFSNLDLKVRYTKGDDMESRLIAIFGPKPSPDKYDEIIDYIDNQIDLVKVTDIPINLNCTGYTNGYVNTTYFYGIKDMKEEYYRKLPSCIKEIGLEGNCTDNTKCMYVHEMAHALINRHKGNIINLLNNEVFSIFMEKVAAEDLDESGELLDLKNFYRIIQTKYEILEREITEFQERNFRILLENEMYIISTLRATALFQTYTKGSKNLKREIESSLGKVTMDEDTLENVLKHYEASLDRGSRIMKRQIKSYHSKIGRR